MIFDYPVTRDSPYRLEFHDHALKEWQDLDGDIKNRFKKLLEKRLVAPYIASSALKGALAGYYKIKLRKEGYRLIYRVIEQKIVVLVVAVGKRDKNQAYKAAQTRHLKNRVDASPQGGKWDE